MREDIAHGADVIKLCVTGWVDDAFANPNRYEISDSELVATLVAVSGNPLDDIANLEHIVFVMRDGRIVRREGVLGR